MQITIKLLLMILSFIHKGDSDNTDISISCHRVLVGTRFCSKPNKNQDIADENDAPAFNKNYHGIKITF